MEKLFIVGDSVIKGVYCAADTGKYTLIEDSGFKSFSNDGFAVENKAVIGATMSKCKRILQNCDLSSDNTSVLFSFGGNDCNYNWKEISEKPFGTFTPATDEDEFVCGYSDMISYVREKGCSVIMTNLAPIDANKFFKTISKGLSGENILRWLGDEYMLYRWHEHYNLLVEKIANMYGCEIADIRSPFIVSHDYSSLISCDGIHPTKEGHALIRETLKNCLLRKNGAICV